MEEQEEKTCPCCHKKKVRSEVVENNTQITK